MLSIGEDECGTGGRGMVQRVEDIKTGCQVVDGSIWLLCWVRQAFKAEQVRSGAVKR